MAYTTSTAPRIDSPVTVLFAAHVELIVKQDGCSESIARFRAWCEGPNGFDRRMNTWIPID